MPQVIHCKLSLQINIIWFGILFQLFFNYYYSKIFFLNKSQMKWNIIDFIVCLFPITKICKFQIFLVWIIRKCLIKDKNSSMILNVFEWASWIKFSKECITWDDNQFEGLFWQYFIIKGLNYLFFKTQIQFSIQRFDTFFKPFLWNWMSANVG